MESHIDVHGSVQDVIDIAHRLAESGAADEDAGWMGRAVRRLIDATHHTRAQDREAIQYHYDVSNAFYAEWLDPAMVYSCAYFENGDETLAEAQAKKIDHILTKLRLQPGQTLLYIGCGWGALVLRAAGRFGARCVGITLSRNQLDLATERVRAAGLQDRVEIRLQDYRDVQGTFDRVSSVGMFEHVGLKNLAPYFRIVHDLLAPGGWALNHGITSTNVFGNVDSNAVCVQLGGAGALANIFSHGGAAPDDFRLRKRQEATVRLPGYAGGTGQDGVSLGQVVAFIRGQNTGSAGEPGSASASGAGGGYTNGAACPTPP